MPAARPAKLSVWPMLIQAHRDVIGAGGDFARFFALLLVVLLALDAALNWIYWPIQQATAGQTVAVDGIYFLASRHLWPAIGAIVGFPLHRHNTR